MRLPILLAFSCFSTLPLILSAQSVPDSQELKALPIQKSDAFSPALTLEAIDLVSNAVADWQMANPSPRRDSDWTEGALWTGLFAHAEATGNEKVYEYLSQVSKGLNFGLGPSRGFADDHCVGQLHLWNYLKDEFPSQLKPTYEILSEFVDRPHDEDLWWEQEIHSREWAWCDSLFMGPPTLAALYSATGETRFIDTMDRLWWKTTDYLYDSKSHLFFRDSRYKDKKEANGEKVFWARGNGWVFAGLCHVLQHLPENHPSRPRYLKLFKEMANELKRLQLDDGSWHASLLDPASFPAPETSGTAFFAYGFAWGINNGHLDAAAFWPALSSAWKRLVQNVHADGKLGYIQPIGDNPRDVSFDMTAVYGVGGFLDLASELRMCLRLKGTKRYPFSVENPSNRLRLNAPVRIEVKELRKKFPKTNLSQLHLRDQRRGKFLQLQWLDEDGDKSPEAVLFALDLLPNDKRSVEWISGVQSPPTQRASQLHARFVPERKDDFAWENDRIAFRLYGPALIPENARGGIDVWTKSVRTPVIDSWYKLDNYHTNNGTGLDGYKVADTLGCGGLGYLDSTQKFHPSPVFRHYRLIHSGPLRLSFELEYFPIKIENATITEFRRLTMDAGSHAFQVDSRFLVEGNADGIRPVAGLALRDASHRAIRLNSRSIAYWDPIMLEKSQGHTGTFIITQAPNRVTPTNNAQQELTILAQDLNKPVRYHAGAFWSVPENHEKIGDFHKSVLHLIHEIDFPITAKP